MVTVKSAAFTAGFKLERVLNWVEKISAQGEILDDAQLIEVAWPESPAQVSGRASDVDALVGESSVPASAVDEGAQAAAKAPVAATKAQAAAKEQTAAPKAAVPKAAGRSKNPGVTLNVQGTPKGALKGADASRGAGSSKQQGGKKPQQGASRGAGASKPSGTKKPQQGKRPQGSSKASQASKKSGNR